MHIQVARARQFSLYLERLLTVEPRLLETVDLASPCKVSTETLRANDKATLYHALRQLRRRTMATLIVRDLAGWANLAEVTQAMTRLAEVTVRAALDWITGELSNTAGTPRNADGEAQPLMVVGMGKLGGAELNVSSDIDLVFVYPEEGETDGTRHLSNHEYFSRVGRALIAALSELTEDGFVFRVDMRLRPYGESGPLAVSFDMLENYLITQGREWERYAWIKARVLNGVSPGDNTEALMALVRPFVYRRHLDYSAFASMRDLHSQIRREVERRDRVDDIKLGRGGIREIEFIAQVFQLIRGGHDAKLRQQPTLDVMALLAEYELLPAGIVSELSQAYVFLRNLEHRLQYRDDQQTHAVPADATTREKIAHSMGLADFAALLSALNAHRNAVARQFDALFADTPAEAHPLAVLWTQSSGSAAVTESLAALGFERPADLQIRLAQIHGSARYRQMPAVSQSRLDRLAPYAIEAAAAGANRDVTLERLLQFLESVSRRESYLALLEEYPQARQNLAELMRSSPWVAQYLTMHPILLDELLDARTLHTPPDWRALALALRSTLDNAGGDAEKQMDMLRHFKHAQTLRLIAQDLSGGLPLETLSDHLSDLACIVLAETLRLAWQGMRQRHRDAPAFAIIGYGKLGGKELGYASDLDLVFLYDDNAPEAPQYYARLAQRINTWLTSTTSAGQLYDTDLRLRPDGASGLTVSHFAGFRDYQQRQAWVWEHQALSRARFVAGDPVIGAHFETLRIEVLRAPRDLESLRSDIAAMREKMHVAHPNNSTLFDLKHDRGGIVDIEFIVQYLVLGHAHEHAALTGNIGNLALLKLAAQLRLIAEAPATAVHAAYRDFRRLQHALRLQGEPYARVSHESVHAHAAAVR
ncbi:MAG TPA: bifunctional [glutamate--ammonia ligase]-adenylyl-L-tyrosine phosphorylase/[glutamate--ammonia-ligase] adenylyltransferase, partial [Burkholderiales bacterium]|nr:bifunctional [glutamate--ammonia ligase]-adenylyl-L-tyrosine phosphorylase/[glutamate--ammonia-ligase] adenylyltransferase [Burkholderiales bacterium]